jgi:hypothetical protein
MSGTVRIVFGSAAMAETHWRPGAQPSLLEHIGKVLREITKVFRHERLPERWIELIKRLDLEEEASSRDREQPRR